MKIAFTSSDGRTVDQHFGMATHLWVWDVGPDRAALVGPVTPLSPSDDEEDRIAARAQAIAGCAVVYTVQIGGPAAAKLVARRIHAMKTGGEVPVAGAIEELQRVLRGRPPPWLRRALEQDAAHATGANGATGDAE